MPRSGTSLISKIVEEMGFNFELTQENSLDQIYNNTTHDSFYQNKYIHLYLQNLGVNKFISYTKSINLDLFSARVIKEPYALYILKQLRPQIDKIILLVRNPNDVILSIKKFASDNKALNGINIKIWREYYKTFLNSVDDIPYLVVNYEQLINSPKSVVKNLFSFLNVQEKPLDIQIYNKPHSSLSNLEAIDICLYKNLSEGLPIEFQKIDNSTNAICFCGSGRKFKKCCKFFTLKL